MKTTGRKRFAGARNGKHSFGHTEWTLGDNWVEMLSVVQNLRGAQGRRLD